jgi:hypothetical protein
MDVKFEVQDLFEKLRPNAKVHDSLEEAAEALNEIVAKYAKPLETVGDGSDGTSEKSDDEQDQRPPVDDEEPEDEDEKPEDMEVIIHRI